MTTARDVQALERQNKTLRHALGQMAARMESSIRILAAISSLTDIMLKSNDVDAATDRILNVLILNLENLENCSIMLFDETQDVLKLTAAKGPADLWGMETSPYNLDPSFKPGQGVAGRVFADNAPIFIDRENCLLKNLMDVGLPNPPKVLACMPLSAIENRIGVLNISFDEHFKFSQPVRRDLIILSNVVSNIIQTIYLKTDVIRRQMSLAGQVRKRERQLAERVKKEQVLIEAQAELEQNIQKRTHALQQINQRLEKEIDRRSKIERSYRSFARIGQALSGQSDIGALLESIVYEARRLSGADAGTLYMVDKDKQTLYFKIVQNDTMGSDANAPMIDLPNVPLHRDGRPNYANVSSYCALTGEMVNIPDVYLADGFDFTGPRYYDAVTGYRSKSMLVMPLKNHENDIIGIIQLLNAKSGADGEVIPFSADHVELIASLASQAAVALTNTRLIQNFKELFSAFTKSIATAIDEKSPFTGGHIKRVVDLTMLIVHGINHAQNGCFADVRFSEEQMEEMRMAAWLHDVGKITTPEYIINKGSKLESIADGIHRIETRYRLISQSIKTDFLEKKLTLYEQNKPAAADLAALDQQLADTLKAVDDELAFIQYCNRPDTCMKDEYIRRIRKIMTKTYCCNGKKRPRLKSYEAHNLCIRKGTLNHDERMLVENHVHATTNILKQLPFPKSLANVPEYASSHHERLDGSGYPLGLSKAQMPLQSRIIAIADIFEAITARDRPYRNPIKLSQALNIIKLMKKNNHIDPDIYALFIEGGLYRDYVKTALSPSQLDD